MSHSQAAAGIGVGGHVAGPTSAGAGVLLRASLGLRVADPSLSTGRGNTDVAGVSGGNNAGSAEVAAWLIPGGDASLWISELLAWAELSRADLASLALYVLPRSPRDLQPGALLAVLPGVSGAAAHYHGRMQPYSVLGGRLYLPRDTALFPHVTRDELLTLCHYPVLVLHPGIGAVGFDTEARLSIAQLLQSPAGAVTEGWDFARPGLELHGRLIYVEMRMPASLGELFGGAQSDIGADPIKLPQPAGKPPGNGDAPGQRPGQGPGETLVAGEGQTTLFGKPLQDYLKWLPGITAPALTAGASWVDKAAAWMARGQQQASEQLQAQRDQELNRLLRMLENDPDQGLRHALPLTSSAERGISTRGKAQDPGSTLGNKDPRFTLRTLAGGYAVEGWGINPDIQAKLRQRYIQLALQETKLGRHQRAAYIYAELLGDLSSAANVLKQGGFYREAAVLYRDHLNRPLEAAECLAKAGQINEAVVIYEKHDRMLDCARLCRQIGREEDAIRYFRRSINAHIRSDNLLGAATELEDNLQDHDEALKVLASAWPEDPRAPKSKQAAGCVTRYFQKAGAMGRHQEAARMLARLKAAPDDPRLQVPYLLLRVHGEYPDARVVETAGDIARVKIGRLLPSHGAPSSQAEVSDLLRLLQQLDAEDRLLGRDTGRFMAQRNETERHSNVRSAPPTRKPAPTGMAGTISCINFKPLGKGKVKWRQIAGNGYFVCAWGWGEPLQQRSNSKDESHVASFVRWSPNGSQETVWAGEEMRTMFGSGDLEMELGSRPSMPVLLRARKIGTLPMHSLPADDTFPHAVEVGQPGWLPADVHTLASDANMMLWQLRRVGNLHYISGSSYKGHQFSNAKVPDELERLLLEHYNDPIRMHCLEDQLVIALGTHVVTLGPSQTIGFSEDLSERRPQPGEPEETPRFLSMATGPRNTPPRFVITDTDSVTLITLRPKRGSVEKTETLDLPGTSPQACFTTDGALAVIAGGECKILESTPAGLIVRASVPLYPASKGSVGIVGIVPGFNPGEFVVLDKEGMLHHMIWKKNV